MAIRHRLHNTTEGPGLIVKSLAKPKEAFEDLYSKLYNFYDRKGLVIPEKPFKERKNVYLQIYDPENKEVWDEIENSVRLGSPKQFPKHLYKVAIKSLSYNPQFDKTSEDFDFPVNNTLRDKSTSWIYFNKANGESNEEHRDTFKFCYSY